MQFQFFCVPVASLIFNHAIPVLCASCQSYFVVDAVCVPTGQAFRQGEYVVTYVAYDAENNSAECSFEIIIRRKLVFYFSLFPFDLWSSGSRAFV